MVHKKKRTERNKSEPFVLNQRTGLNSTKSILHSRYASGMLSYQPHFGLYVVE